MISRKLKIIEQGNDYAVIDTLTEEVLKNDDLVRCVEFVEHYILTGKLLGE